MKEVKTLKLNGRKMEVPNIFISYRMGDFPSSGLKCLPWKQVDIDALLINAYDFINKKHNHLLNADESLKDSLKFDKTVMMDSGGFYFSKRDEIDVNPLEILEVQYKSNVDISVVLDHPINPKINSPLKRMNITLKNTEVMFEALHQNGFDNQINLIPVIHGYDVPTLDYFIDNLEKIAGKFNLELDTVGIGSLAPLSQRSDIRLSEIISHVRDRFPDSHLHCFSLGSALMMLVAFLNGADTVDTQGWIINAVYRYINLPGMGATKLRLKDKDENEKLFMRNYNKLSEHLDYLEKYEGFKPLYPLEDLIDLPDESRLHNRAMHNLYVYVYEARMVREAMKKDFFDEFIIERFSRNNRLTKFIGVNSK